MFMVILKTACFFCLCSCMEKIERALLNVTDRFLWLPKLNNSEVFNYYLEQWQYCESSCGSVCCVPTQRPSRFVFSEGCPSCSILQKRQVIIKFRFLFDINWDEIPCMFFAVSSDQVFSSQCLNCKNKTVFVCLIKDRKSVV